MEQRPANTNERRPAPCLEEIKRMEWKGGTFVTGYLDTPEGRFEIRKVNGGEIHHIKVGEINPETGIYERFISDPLDGHEGDI